MNFTGIDFTTIPDNSLAYIAFDLEYGFRLLEEKRDLNAVYFRDLSDPDVDGVSDTAVTTQGLIIKSSLVAYNGSLAPLEDRVGKLIKIGDTWATVLLYNSNRSVVVDNYPTKLPPIQSIQNNLINVPLHGLANNEPIQFSGATPPIGIIEGTTYYVRNPTANSFNISATSGGSNITLTDRAGELHVSKLYSVFVPTLDYDVIKDTIIGKVIRTGNFYTVETFYNVSGESITSFELVDALPAAGNYEGQVVLFENTIYTWNGVSWVTGAGTSSRTVSLGTSKQAFTYDSNGTLVVTDPVQSGTITATAFGTTGVLTYDFKIDGTGTGPSSSNTFVYPPNASYDAMPDIVTVDLYEDGLLVANDLITMFGVIEGSDAITIVLSNEAHTIPTDSDGNNGVFTGSGTSIQVFRGNTPLNYVSGVGTNSFDVSFTDEGVEGGSVSGSGTTATIGDITIMGAPTGRRDITITVYSGATVSTFSKVQSFSKSVAGVNGAAGVIYYVDTSASAIKRNLDGTLDPSTITFSAFSVTGNSAPVAYAGRFRVYRNNVLVYTSASNETSYVYTPATPSTLENVKVELYLAGGTTTLLDQETLPVVQDGSSAITVSVDNDNVSFAGPVTGYVGIVFGSATSTTRVYRGSTLLNYATSGANTWNVTAQSSTGVTVATGSGSGTTYIVPVPTAMSIDAAFTDLTITVRNEAGVASTFNARITYSLSRAGAAGANSVIYYVDTSASAIKRNLDGTLDPSTITFSAFSVTGNSAPVAYAGRFRVYRNNVLVYTSASNETSYVYTPATPSTLENVKVELYLAGGTTTLLDQETLPVVQDGSSAITVSVDNDNVSFAGPVTGYVGIVFGSATSTTRVYRGSTLLNYATSGANTWNVTTQSSTGVTVATGSGSGTTYVVPVPTAMSIDAAFTDLTITVRNEAGVASTFNARITYSLSRAGIDGVAGVIYYVSTSASAIKRNLDGTLDPATVTFSAFSVTANNAPVAYAGRFRVYRNNVLVYTSASNETSYVYTPATPSTLENVKVELYLAGGTTTLLDQETLPVVQDGSSAITVSVDNDNVSFAGPVTGYVGIVFGSATSTTRVYRGSTLLNYATSGANTWNVTTQSSTGVTVATGSGSGTTYVVPVPTAMSIDAAFTDLTITVRNEAGVASTFNARITYSLSRAGANGDPGTPGTPGTAAVSGYLTNESQTLFAYANGVITSYAPATGSFVIVSGNTDVSTNFALSTASNPQNLTVNYTNRVYTISAGFDANEDSATLTIRATGSGAFAGVTIDKVFSLSKARGGYEIVSSLPGAGDPRRFQGNVVFLTTDNKLYRYNGSAWVASVPALDISGQLTAAQIASLAASQITGQLTDAQLASIAAAKIAGQLTDTQLAAIASTKITGQLTNAQLADIAATKITGTLSDAQLANIAATKITGTITGTQISDGAISTAKIAAGAITASQIAADTITAANIAANAITASELAAGSVVAGKVAANAITANEIAANSITTGKIAAGAIVSASIAADTITAANIAANAITASELAAGSVIAGKVAAGAITADEIAANSITTAKIAAGAVVAANIAAGTITAAQIAADTITANQIAANAITASELNANAVTADKISAGAITAGKIGVNAVVANNINVDQLSAISANMGTITAGEIRSGTTGQNRLIITPGVIEVFDSANVRRVRLGVWT